MKSRWTKFLMVAALCVAAEKAVEAADSPYLSGLHWYGDTTSNGVELLTGGKGVWILETGLTNSNAAINAGNIWEIPWQVSPTINQSVAYAKPGWMSAITGKSHTVVYRLQPHWSNNVPDAADPYTTTTFAADCKASANLMKNIRFWQVGNEVNLLEENKTWNGSGYGPGTWAPTPEQYAAMYVASRDKIHEVTPLTSPAQQVVLMQPVSPGDAVAGVRYIDGNEFLWRMIAAVPDKSKIDGFAIHAYGPAGSPAVATRDWWDSVREQLMIIEQFGLSNRPVLLTEWNMEMNNASNAANGAQFLQQAMAYANEWNTTSTSLLWPGQPNTKLRAATWFVYPDVSGWQNYSLLNWKKPSGGTINNDPWLAFQHVANQNYAAGTGAGAVLNAASQWWVEEFTGSSLDDAGPLPAWRGASLGTGNAVVSGGGLTLTNGATGFSLGSVRTTGYVFGDFFLETEVLVQNGNRVGSGEANFEIRYREGSKGYSLTFYSDNSTVAPGSVRLREVNNWGNIYKQQTISGGVKTNDRFSINVTASGANLSVRVIRLPSQEVVVDWTGANRVSNSDFTVGTIRYSVYNLNSLRIERAIMGGPAYTFGASVADWRRETP